MSSQREGGRSRYITLHLLRHAHAGDPGAWDGPDDLRPLTRRGRRQAEHLGVFLESRGHRPDVIMSSPRVRALQTAEIVGAELGMTVRSDPRLAEPFGLTELRELLEESGARAPMLVGHDPDFSDLLVALTGAAQLSMRKGELATLDIDSRNPVRAGRLRWLVPPDLLGPE